MITPNWPTMQDSFFEAIESNEGWIKRNSVKVSKINQNPLVKNKRIPVIKKSKSNIKVNNAGNLLLEQPPVEIRRFSIQDKENHLSTLMMNKGQSVFSRATEKAGERNRMNIKIPISIASSRNQSSSFLLNQLYS